MRELIFDLLTKLGTTAIIAAAIAWLARSAVTHFLSRDLEAHKSELTHDVEAYKANLKREADIEVERLKSSLLMSAQERQVVFNSLHEKRATVIAECYALLCELVPKAHRFGGHVAFGGGGAEVQKNLAEDAHNKCVELSTHFRKHRIYFSEELCRAMNDFLDLIGTTTSNFYYIADDPEERMKFQTEFNKNLIPLMDEEEGLRRALEREFRVLLGVGTIGTAAPPRNVPDVSISDDRG